MITIIPQDVLNNLQMISNNFVWKEKAKIKASILQLPIYNGGLAFPNLILYHHAATLSAMVQ